MTRDKGIALAVIIATLAAAWLFRYDATAGDSDAAYVTDRWTGHIYRCVAANCFQTFPPINWIDLKSN